MNKSIIATVAVGSWIGFSEFLRNELLFKSYWLNHYEKLGVLFPSTMANNAVWAIWSFVLAGLVVYLSGKLSAVETGVVSWLFAFLLMWLVAGNLNVLPLGLLVWAVPLSLVEIIVAVILAKKIR